MKQIYTGIVFALCSVRAYGATCPPAYPNSESSTNICYLITAPGEYVAAPGSGVVPCPVGDYCPGGDKIYDITIPERYTPVEYLENNEDAYIDTGHIPTSATTVNADVMITDENFEGSYQPYMGAQLSFEERYAFFMRTTGTGLTFDYFNDIHQTSYTTTNNLFNKRFNVKTQISDNQIYALFDNVPAYSTAVTPAPDFDTGIYLFAIPKDSRRAHGRFYFYQVRESDELVQDMIPVYDTESKLYGMYDMIGGKFFTSANSTKFTGGPILADHGGNFSCADATNNEFISSPPKSEVIMDCGKILHVGANKIYLRRRKITPHALAARVGDTIFYAETTTEKCGHMRVKLDDAVYSICNIGAD